MIVEEGTKIDYVNLSAKKIKDLHETFDFYRSNLQLSILKVSTH